MFKRNVIVALLVVVRCHCSWGFQVPCAITSPLSRSIGHRVKSLSSETSTRLFVSEQAPMDKNRDAYFMEEKEPPKEPSPVVTAGDSPKAVKLRNQAVQERGPLWKNCSIECQPHRK